MADEVVTPQRAPYVMEVGPGSVYWCRCGRSKTQPYCDGSHTGTGFTPIEVEFRERQRVAFCGCKHTKKPPFCDGTHVQAVTAWTLRLRLGSRASQRLIMSPS